MYSIGRLSETTGVKIPTIRYYEQIGLLPEPARTSGNQRRYEKRHLDRLAFIRHARDLGFAIEAIKDLLDLASHPEHPCADIDRIAFENLQVVEAKIEKLGRLRKELKRMLKDCKGENVESCHILEVISDHKHCEDEH